MRVKGSFADDQRALFTRATSAVKITLVCHIQKKKKILGAAFIAPLLR